VGIPTNLVSASSAAFRLLLSSDIFSMGESMIRGLFVCCHVKKWDGIRKDGGCGNERGVAYESGFDSMGICEERERERVFDCEIVCDTIEY